MTDIQWKVGDTGLTRDGRPYVVTRVHLDSEDYPYDASIDGEEGACFSVTGSRWIGETHASDLMPPAAQTPAPTRDEGRERIACAVLVGLAADRHRSDVQGNAENAACIAVAWADALIAELAK